MGCNVECVVDETNHQCCLECDSYGRCDMTCSYLDSYEYVECCPDYVKEDEDNENN